MCRARAGVPVGPYTVRYFVAPFLVFRGFQFRFFMWGQQVFHSAPCARRGDPGHGEFTNVKGMPWRTPSDIGAQDATTIEGVEPVSAKAKRVASVAVGERELQSLRLTFSLHPGA